MSDPVPVPRPSETPPTPVNYVRVGKWNECIHCHTFLRVDCGADWDKHFCGASYQIRPPLDGIDGISADWQAKAEAARRSPSVPTAAVNNETNVARAEADRNVREIVRHFNLTGCKIEGATLRAFILGVLEAVSPVPSSEEAANSTQPEISLDEAIAALRRHGFATVATLAEHARRESAAASVQGENSQ